MIEVRIPKIGTDELKLRHDKIKPVISRNGRLYRLRGYSLHEIQETSYYANREADIVEVVPANELEVLDGLDFYCLHPYDFMDKSFKPTVADVLAQISRRDLRWVKAFEIIEAPQRIPGPRENTLQAIAYSNGYHVSMVRLYGSGK